MNGSLLEKYNQYFLKLNRGFNKGMGYAPHKPILLLSVIQLIESGIISSNRIFITPELVLAFKENWQKLVETPHTENFALPFFHLRSEPFWRLITYNGIENLTTTSKSIKSFKALKDNVAFAEIDKDLFLTIFNSNQSSLLTQTLLETYFPATKKYYSNSLNSHAQQQIEMQILNEPKEEYQNHIQQLKYTLDIEKFEEEIFIRGACLKG